MSDADIVLSSSSPSLVEPFKELSVTCDAGNGPTLQGRVWENNERHKEGGLRYKDDAELKLQRGIAWEVVKSLGNSILEGKELTTTCLPIHLFEPRSFLERLTDIWAYLPKYLSKAAEMKDPVERMKYVIAFSISGLHLLTTVRKPFNPILGETYQAFFPNGTQVFCEQTTHHPPASNFEVIPTDNSFRFYGSCTWGGSSRANTIKGTQKGPSHVDFADGSRITYTLPEILIKGLMWGDRIMQLQSSMIFSDEKNGLEAEVVFNPEAMGFVKSLFSKCKEYSGDSLKGEIYRVYPNSSGKKKAEDIICPIEGSWLSHLDIDGKRFWDISMVPIGVNPHPSPLPSDCRFRTDLCALKAGEVEKGKECKVQLEERQRYEKKLRLEGKKQVANESLAKIKQAGCDSPSKSKPVNESVSKIKQAGCDSPSKTKLKVTDSPSKSKLKK